MRRLALAAVAASLALSACQTRRPEGGGPSASPKAEPDCQGWRRYVPGPGVSAAALSPETMDEAHVAVRGSTAGVRPDSGPILRTRIGGGLPSPELTEESSVVHRGPDGVWRISRVELYPYDVPEPQWEVLDGQTPTPVPVKPNRKIYEGPLPDQVARLIEAALAGPCYRDEPAPAPRPRAADAPPEPPCPPDSSGYALEIIENGRSRIYLRSCHATGAGGSLLDLVAGSHPELRDPPPVPPRRAK